MSSANVRNICMLLRLVKLSESRAWNKSEFQHSNCTAACTNCTAAHAAGCLNVSLLLFCIKTASSGSPLSTNPAGGGLDAEIPWLVGMMRIVAILAGILLCFVLSVVWFPVSSHKQGCHHLLDMMKGVRQLADLTWQMMDQKQQLQMQQQQQMQKMQQQFVASHALTDASGSKSVSAASASADQADTADRLAAPAQLATLHTTLPGSSNASSSKAANITDSSSSSSDSKAPVAITADVATTADVAITADVATTADVAITADVATTADVAGPADPAVCVQLLDASAAALQELEDKCEAAMRQTYQSHAAMKDSLAAAEAERHMCWIGGARILTPKAVSCLCCMNSSCNSSDMGSGQQQPWQWQQPLPCKEVAAVGLALRRSMHVWWVLRRLLLDHSCSGSLQLLANTL
jgi:hypothetical protein